eukprot:TRINITY_DN4358_c2_g1_i10.p1 TRINITY_DN4358_c2_g1~~TRINITY_DN4358_c2_g1_i10.p1  ORF type:complete len:459 (+),score=71.01 TRINITY_DN4358_c2_g1_i10:82-1458(+)
MARSSCVNALVLVVCFHAWTRDWNLQFISAVGKPRLLHTWTRQSCPVKRRLFNMVRGESDEVAELAPSWEELQAELQKQQTSEEKTFRQELADGRGPPSAMAKLRIFDKTSKEAEYVTLYRDSASWCPYCHKVWVLLEEKQIPYKVEKINMNCYGDKPDSFRQIQPSGTLPAAIIGDTVLQSSDAIIQKLLGMPGSSPEIDATINPFDDPRANGLLALDDQLGGAWLAWLRRGRGDGTSFQRLLQKVEEALASDDSGPYFLGERFSLVDIMYLPYFERAVASLVYFKGFNIRDPARYPAINAWLDAMETRPSVRATKSDYYTHSHDLPPQIGGCGSEPLGARVREEVNGDAWRLPLKSDMTEPDWGWISPAAARREAAERLSHNGMAVARFAARGASLPGFPPVMAELSDPRASPAEEWLGMLDMLLRHVASLLLAGDELLPTLTMIALRKGLRQWQP